MYDTVKELKWSVDVRTHGIAVIIDSLLAKNLTVPKAEPEDDCVVSFEEGSIVE